MSKNVNIIDRHMKSYDIEFKIGKLAGCRRIYHGHYNIKRVEELEMSIFLRFYLTLLCLVST